MNWKQITQDLIAAYGSVERLARLAICQPRTIRAIAETGRSPSYEVGDRLIRMHECWVDAGRPKK